MIKQPEALNTDTGTLPEKITFLETLQSRFIQTSVWYEIEAVTNAFTGHTFPWEINIEDQKNPNFAIPTWAVRHLVQNGISADTTRDIFYGTVRKGVSQKGEITNYESILELARQYNEAGRSDNAFNLLMSWDLYHHIEALFKPKKLHLNDFRKSIFLEKKVAEAISMERNIRSCYDLRYHEKVLNTIIRAEHSHLYLKAARWAERLYQDLLYFPGAQETRAQAVLAQLRCLSALSKNDTYFRPNTNLENTAIFSPL